MIRRCLLLASLLFVACQEVHTKKVGNDGHSDVTTLLESGSYWSYRTADVFADGGSVAMGFINSNGEVLYVIFDYSIYMDKNYRPCRLKRTYHDSGAVEILPGSELERKVLALIENAICPEELEAMLPLRDKAKEILKTRSLELNLMDSEPIVPHK